MWVLFDIVLENARQEQSHKYNIGVQGSPQPSPDKPVSEQTTEEKRANIAKGRIWLEKAKANSQQK